jgi:3-phenylpropionate/trans-cinnamate dioxygenase ferredoxin reductase subunit
MVAGWPQWCVSCAERIRGGDHDANQIVNVQSEMPHQTKAGPFRRQHRSPQLLLVKIIQNADDVITLLDRAFAAAGLERESLYLLACRRASRPGHHGRRRFPVTATRLVIVGGGPAGLEAARAYREASPANEVVLVSADEHMPYNRPPLSKDFLRGESGEESLPLEDDDWYREHRIEVRLRTPAQALDPIGHVITLIGGETLDYDHCILATGATPKPLPVPGGDGPAVYYLRSRGDARRLREAAAAARSAVVVGSGFIGCEAAASLARRGLTVTLVTMENLPQVARLGDAAGQRLRRWLEDDGVTLRLGAEIEAIEDSRRVRLTDGSSADGDLVLVAGGVDPGAALATQAGLTVAQERVRVDAHMGSSRAGVLAAGDVAFAFNAAAGRHLSVEHWGDALAMGRIAGLTAAGQAASWAEVPGFWSTIGERTLQYAAWGDGFDSAQLVDHGEGAFTVWYGQDGVTVGVLAHGAEDDCDRGQRLIEERRPVPVGPNT